MEFGTNAISYQSNLNIFRNLCVSEHTDAVPISGVAYWSECGNGSCRINWRKISWNALYTRNYGVKAKICEAKKVSERRRARLLTVTDTETQARAISRCRCNP